MEKNFTLDREDFLNLADLFKLFSNSARVQIIWELSKCELCVGDIALKLQMTQPAISQHLKELKQNRILKSRKEAQTVFYSLEDGHIMEIVTSGAEHIKGEHCYE